MTLTELGQKIQARREEAGMTIDYVAMRIKVSPRILQAIEGGEREILPHAVYTKGFIRSFALVVGLTPEDIAAHLEEIFSSPSFQEEGADAKIIARLHVPPPSALKRKILVLFFVLCLLAGIGGGAYYLAVRYSAAIWDFIKQPFSAITIQDAPGDSPQETPPAAHNGGAFAGLLPAAAQPSSPPPQVLEVPPPAPEEDASLPAVSRETPGAIHVLATNSSLAPEGGPQKVEVKATQECWIRFRVDNARTREHFTLFPGQSRSFSFKDSLEIHLGNAGGIRLLYNNQDLGSLGRSGEVKIIRFPDDASVRAGNP
ncbi:MAG: DUF4115 domain-containing protein [Desulfovibrio sp.]|jgi:cytoskeleton protein RodZ|nr:DUF4115 domain-containing protein [Desulfovibrio sp.]